MSVQKIKLDIAILLPEIPDERDACVQRLVKAMQQTNGIEDVHVVERTADNPARLCFHYNPDRITLNQVKQLAEKEGAAITERYHHLVVNVEGITHQRKTNLVEASLQKHEAVKSVSAAATGIVRIEFDTRAADQEQVIEWIKEAGLVIRQLPNVPGKKETHVHKAGEHNHHEEGEHNHSHGGIFGKNTELIFSILCGIMLAAGFGLSYIKAAPQTISLVLYIAAYFFGGFYTVKEAVESIAKGKFEIDFLMFVAAIGAAILGDWAEGALLLFLFSLGHALEHFAMEKARKSIAALTELAPKTALLKTGNEAREVRIEELKQGDIIVVRPNTKIAADGFIVKGKSSVNQAPITGESIPVDKTAVDNPDISIESAERLDAQHRVFSGTINGNEVLEVKVTKPASDSTIARLVTMVNEAQTQKSPTQVLTDKIEKYFVPAVLILVVLLCFAFLVVDETFSRSFYRAMSVLVAASPCALAIATPSAVLSGVARAARAGVLIKGGKPLEDLGTLTALAFDKTGTLTEGKPRLTRIVALGQVSETELLKTAVAVEALSDHPLAKAIVRDGKERLKGAQLPIAHNLEAVLGKGIKASLEGDEIFAGNLALFESLDDAKPSKELEEQVHKLEEAGNTTMIFRKSKDYTGIIAVMDTPRAEAKQTLAQLKSMGIKRMVMLTGDNQKVAEAVAAQTGLTDAWGGLLPEQKVEAVKKLKEQEGKVAMVGDGVNDAPAMANSTVGIAMGAAGSDVALETADIALMGDKLSLLPFAIGLSRKAKSIIKQNLFISLGMVVVLIPLTILGIASIGPAVIAHEGSTLVVVFNALRLLAYKKKEMNATPANLTVG